MSNVTLDTRTPRLVCPHCHIPLNKAALYMHLRYECTVIRPAGGR